jgi:hypothetical protein
LDSPLGRPDRVDKLEQRQALLDKLEHVEVAVDEVAEVDEALLPISRRLDPHRVCPMANPTSVDTGPIPTRRIWQACAAQTRSIQ